MAGIILKPEPYCPDCGGRMKLKRPGAGKDWKPFWGCANYPACKGTRNIDPETGKPESDEIVSKYDDMDPSLDDDVAFPDKD